MNSIDDMEAFKRYVHRICGWNVRHSFRFAISCTRTAGGLGIPALIVWVIVSNNVFDEFDWARWDESELCTVVQAFEYSMMFHRSSAASCQDRWNQGALGRYTPLNEDAL